MIEKLVQVTDREVQHSFHVPLHTTPVSLAWAVAQRGNPEVSIEASIEWVYIPFGHLARVLTTLSRKCRPGKYVYIPVKDFSLTTLLKSGYWSGLISSTDFTGKKLRECLDVIHNDIILVWNIRDPSDVSPFYSSTSHCSTLKSC
jgi:hypothetical protein